MTRNVKTRQWGSPSTPDPATVKEAETVIVSATCGGCGEVTWRIASSPAPGVVQKIAIAQGEGESTTITLTGAAVLRDDKTFEFLPQGSTEGVKTIAGVTATRIPSLQQITSYFDIVGLKGEFDPTLVVALGEILVEGEPPQNLDPNTIAYTSFPGQAHSVRFKVENDPPSSQWNFTATGQNGWDMWMEDQPQVSPAEDKKSALVTFMATGGFGDNPVVILRVVAKRMIDGLTISASLHVHLLSGF